ncbi:MAG: glycosyltransferase family 2 protein [Proteobacteria bacterium]|nr:glycosyltransferase family 2 protein [Pseudomonadota bacterium]
MPMSNLFLEEGLKGLFSVVIPAFNEAPNLKENLPALILCLQQANIQHEIVVVNDNSTDDTQSVIAVLQQHYPSIRIINNTPPNGFGLAVRRGLTEFKGDAVIVVMADGSDSPQDVVAFYHKLQEGYDCVFGSRFITKGKIVDYPIHKLLLNRLANNFIRMLFQIRYNDTTNAFKCYRRHVIQGLQPLLAHHFNLTVELPLKAIIRGYRYAVLPNAWYNRKKGVSKLKIREMGSRYLFIVLYCLIEKLFSRGDYKIQAPTSSNPFTLS